MAHHTINKINMGHEEEKRGKEKLESRSLYY
jgi:hypothetical protein